jgi:hypothetical protein
LFQGYADSQLLAFSYRGDAEVREIIQKLPFTGEIPSNRKFDIGERVPDGEKTVSQHVDREQVGIGNALCSRRANEFEKAGRAGLASGMTKVRLVFEFWEVGGAKHAL